MKPQNIAVFTRNHRHYLEEAAELTARDPQAAIVFRSRQTWVTAMRERPVGGSLPIYIAVINGEGLIEYEAELCDGQINPSLSDPKTEALLAETSRVTKDRGEELWEDEVRTLYAIRACRRLTMPFPFTDLVLCSTGKPINPGFRYPYALVHPRRSR